MAIRIFGNKRRRRRGRRIEYSDESLRIKTKPAKRVSITKIGAKDMVTNTNILNNIELETIKTWNNEIDKKDEWKKTATKYNCKITFKNQSYNLSYWMGSALKKAPSKKDVLYSFIMDDVTGMNFEEFCSEFGYDNDSIKALRTFESCEEQTKNFYRLFNEEEREILRELLEDY